MKYYEVPTYNDPILGSGSKISSIFVCFLEIFMKSYRFPTESPIGSYHRKHFLGLPFMSLIPLQIHFVVKWVCFCWIEFCLKIKFPIIRTSNTKFIQLTHCNIFLRKYPNRNHCGTMFIRQINIVPQWFRFGYFLRKIPKSKPLWNDVHSTNQHMLNY